MFNHISIFPFKFYGELTFSLSYKISSAVLIAKSMTANAYRCGPVRDKTRHIVANDRLAKNSTIEDIPDSTIRAFPHLLQTKFFYTRFVRCNGGAFNAHAILFDSIGSINGNLVIGFIAVFNTEIVVFNVNVNIGQYQFVFYEFPDDTC